MYCAQCKFYQKSKTEFENDDLCLHDQSAHDVGIREDNTKFFTCAIMLTGICYNHKLFEPKLRMA